MKEKTKENPTKRLKDRIYLWHVWRERSKTVPPYNPSDEEDLSLSEEERDMARGFAHPETNTVPITVPLANEWGDEYGARIDMITPESAGEIMEGYRQSMVHARHSLWETQFWLKTAKRVILLLLISLIAITIWGVLK